MTTTIHRAVPSVCLDDGCGKIDVYRLREQIGYCLATHLDEEMLLQPVNSHSGANVHYTVKKPSDLAACASSVYNHKCDNSTYCTLIAAPECSIDGCVDHGVFAVDECSQSSPCEPVESWKEAVDYHDMPTSKTYDADGRRLMMCFKLSFDNIESCASKTGKYVLEKLEKPGTYFFRLTKPCKIDYSGCGFVGSVLRGKLDLGFEYEWEPCCFFREDRYSPFVARPHADDGNTKLRFLYESLNYLQHHRGFEHAGELMERITSYADLQQFDAKTLNLVETAVEAYDKDVGCDIYDYDYAIEIYNNIRKDYYGDDDDEGDDEGDDDDECEGDEKENNENKENE